MSSHVVVEEWSHYPNDVVVRSTWIFLYGVQQIRIGVENLGTGKPPLNPGSPVCRLTLTDYYPTVS